MDDDLKEKRFAAVSSSRTFRNIVREFSLGDKKVLDIGCSYGEHLAHFGKGSVGLTTNPKEVGIGKRRGLDIRLGNAEQLNDLDLPKDFSFIWANNLFEHLLSPHSFLMSLKKKARPETILILGVPVVPFPLFLTKFKKFNGAFSDAHINFFTWKTLKFQTEFAGWQVLDVRPFVFPIKTIDRLSKPVAPHIYIIAKNNSNFNYSRGKIQEWENNPMYEEILAIGDKQGVKGV